MDNSTEQFNPDKFRCETELWSVANLYRMCLDDEISYTIPKLDVYLASYYIQQILTKTAVDYFKFYQQKDLKYAKLFNNYITYKGNYRIASLVSYINNKYSLCNLEIFKHVNNFKFTELSKPYQRRILETNLNIFYICENTSEEYRNELVSTN